MAGRGPGNATGGGQADFNAFLVSTSVGCSYINTIEEIDGKLWMLTNRGVEIFDGNSFQLLGGIDMKGRALDLYSIGGSSSFGTNIRDYQAASAYDPVNSL